jgi:ribosomal protein S17E
MLCIFFCQFSRAKISQDYHKITKNMYELFFRFFYKDFKHNRGAVIKKQCQYSKKTKKRSLDTNKAQFSKRKPDPRLRDEPGSSD